MRNLKKMLSLVMALAMVTSFMVVGASAQFSDDKDIKNTDAVETLVSLGVLKGRDTGAFDPAGIVTRAEMAKMICVAMAGGKDPTMAGTGVYPDTKGHWAAGYIDYCANMGYVSGNTDGNFYPNKTVTGTEAAKMILTILGYNAQTEKFVNDANWETNINAIASTKGIYDGVSVIPNQGLSRDDAAQMIYNGLQALMVKYELVGIIGGNGVSKATDITPNKTILTDKFGMKTGYSYLTGVSYDSVKKEFGYTLAADGFGNTAIATADNGYSASVKSAKDYSALYGQKVRTLYKVDNNKTTVYGIYATDSSVLVSGFAGDVKQPVATDTSVKVNGTSYKLTKTANDVVVYNYNSSTSLVNLTALAETDTGYSIKLIDHTGDGKADIAVKVPFTVAQVTYVGKDSLTLDHALGNKKFDDVSIYEGVKKDDIVIYTAAAVTADDTATIVKADVKNAKISSTKTSSGVANYEIDGTWFKKVDVAADGALNDTVDYVAFGSYLYYTKTTSGQKTLADIAVVLGSKDAADGMTGAKWQANLLFSDGTKKVVTTTADATSLVGKMVTYEVNNDSEYLLTVASGTNKAGYENYNDSTAADGNPITTVGGYKVADDAVVFIYFGSGAKDGKIYTGKEFKTLNNTTYATGTQVLTDKVNGFEYAQVIKVEGVKPATITSGDLYGYLTSDTATTKENGKTYRNFVLWTSTGAQKVKEESSSSQLSAGTVIAYNDAGSGIIKNVSVINTTAAAVTGWNGKDIALLNADSTTTSTKITDDSVIIYIDSDKKSGAEGEGIPFAGKPDGTNYAENVRYAHNANGVKVILVDVNNDLKGSSTVSVKGASASVAYLEGTDLYVNVAGSISAATVKGYLSTTLTQSVKVYTGATENTGNVLANDTIKIVWASGDTKTLTIKQGYTVATPAAITNATIDTVDSASLYTVVYSSAALGTLTASTTYMTKPTDVVSVAITCTTKPSAKTDTITLTAANSTISGGEAGAVHTVKFASTITAPVTKTLTFTTLAGAVTPTLAGANA
ncbi:MAG: hypothetical protein EOM52_07795 [Clostridia bacterium]|nr:hypothetical protein [Clostridia bacterium]